MIVLSDGTKMRVGDYLCMKDPIIAKPIKVSEPERGEVDVVKAYLDRVDIEEKPQREVEIEEIVPAGEKRCNECGKVLPLFMYYSNGMGGKQNTCKDCVKVRQETYNIKIKRKKYMDHSATENTKKCARCGRILPLENFSTHNRTRDGLFPICKPCVKESCAEGRAKRRAERETAEAKPTPHQPKEAHPEFKVLGVEAPQVERRPKVEPFLAQIAHEDTYSEIKSGEFLQNIPDDILYNELTRRGFRGAMVKALVS